jgi:hypothetical protein
MNVQRLLKKNDIEYVKKLIRADATVDMYNTNNL